MGNLSQQTLPNGVTETYQYDLLNRLKVLETKNASGTVLSRYSYTYDAVGNKTTVQELGGRSLTYTYDELYRLTKEAIDLPGTANDRTFEYGYDKVGNRWWKKDSAIGQTNYTYNANDWLLSETAGGQTTTYTYDNNGNTLTKTQGSNSTIYTWDAESRLVGASLATSGGTQQLGYRYNAAGVRVTSVVNGLETRYLVDANRPYAQVLEEYAPTGDLKARYVYGSDLDLISQTRGSTQSFYLSDGHSGVRQLTNAAGTVTDTYTYDAYGTLLNSTGNTQNDYRYRGEQTDANLGMQYLRARYYDQKTGRFVSTDPFEGNQEQPVSRHRYLYGNNSPVSYSDPTGMFSLLDLETASKIATTLAATATVQFLAGRVLNAASTFLGGPIEWNGVQVGGSAKGLAPSISGFGTLVRAQSSCVSTINGSQSYTGSWLIVGGSASISPPTLFPFGVSAGLFKASSLRLLGASYAALAGAYEQLGYVFDTVIGVGGSAFTMGFGYGFSLGGLSFGIRYGLGISSGLSIPLPWLGEYENCVPTE